VADRIPLQKTNTSGIYKRVGKTKTTYTVVVAVGVDERGNPIQRRETFPTFDAAKKWRTRVIHEHTLHAYIAPSKQPVGDYLQQWVIDQRGRVKPNTIFVYRQAMARWSSLSSIPLASLTAEQIQRAINEMVKAGLAPSTISQSYKKLRQALSDAVRLRLIPSSPCQDMRAPREVHPEPVSLDEDEVERFREAIRGSLYQTLFEAAIETGLRFSELAALRWEHVDLLNGSIAVVENVSRTEDGKRVVSTPKSKKSIREVVLSEYLTSMLATRYATYLEDRTDDPTWNPRALVFPGPRGGLILSCVVNDHLAAICAQAGIKKITFHGLRHTSGTEQVESGIPIATIAERMGHANPTITLNLYVHPDKASHRRAADAIGIHLRRRRSEIVVKPELHEEKTG
jgi:integrase